MEVKIRDSQNPPGTSRSGKSVSYIKSQSPEVNTSLSKILSTLTPGFLNDERAKDLDQSVSTTVKPELSNFSYILNYKM